MNTTLVENQEEMKVEVTNFIDGLIETKQTDNYTKCMHLLGGEWESDLDDLLEVATVEQMQSVLTFKASLSTEEPAQEQKEEIIEEAPVQINMNSEINKTKRADVFFIDPRLIKVEDGFNTRIDYGDIEELSASIAENGVRVPMRGYKDGEFYVLNDGHRRFKAVQMALNKGIEIARVPFISEKKKSLEERIFDIILFNDGKTLTPLELGETYKKLMAHGYNYSEIAKKIGKTVKHVSDMVGVAGSSKEVKDLIKENSVSATLVAEVKSKVKDQEEAEEIIKTVSSMKKEEAKGDKKKEKVTKKDIEDFLPEPTKEVQKVEETSSEEVESFTKEQVVELLKKQIRACAESLPLNLKMKVLQVKPII